MERIICRRSVILVLFALGALSWPSYAGVVFAPDQGSADANDGFPPSSFGEQPADPVRSQADAPAGFAGHSGRKPAGLVFDSDAQAAERPQTASADPEDGTQTVRHMPESDEPSRGLATPTHSVPDPSVRRMPKEITLPPAPGETGIQALVPDRQKGIQEIALIAGDLGYFPKTFFVSRDVPVRLFVTGASKKPLCIMMDSFQVRRQVTSQKIEEITFTPNMPGQYRFYCPMNGIEGVMVVKELATVQ